MDKYLPEGYVLKFNNRPGDYTVVKVIGKGTSSVAYRAKYTDQDGLDSFHILKEYNPCYVNLTRDDDGTMNCSENDRNKFDTGLSQFISGYKRQSELRNIEKMTNQTPPIQGIFEANNTKYMDVSCYTGKTYDDLNVFNLFDRMKICLSVAKLVQYYHEAGYLCLDIKPENIFIMRGTMEMLQFIDFDSVRMKSEITFGNSLSYTKAWAAPEQVNPGGWSEISEASDIYTVGELIFWSVFERHSRVQEHRRFSCYPFAEGAFAKEMSSQVQMLLSDIFHNSLRSSAKNRYSSMDQLITSLNKVVNELLPNKEYIINSNVHPKDFFVGRDEEMNEIELYLREKKLVFLSGIGGIGKSEIAKYYLTAHKDEYRKVLYMTYEGDLETMICQEDSVEIANFGRIQDETDHKYCQRKLHKIKELLEGENLIIIDNLDIQIENIDHHEVWEYLLTLSCSILITTRCNQAEYKDIIIQELSGIGYLKSIFSYYCTFEKEQTVHVEEIIEKRLGKNTLLVELIAKQTKAEFLTPLAINERLREFGILSFNQENVKLLKDGSSQSVPVAEHVQKIFSMSSMSFEQQLMLVQLAFMPLNGVKANVFSRFYSLKNHNDLNWLMNNGWVNCCRTDNNILSVHPIIASVAVDILKNNKKLQEHFYVTALVAMRKGYDDSGENQSIYNLSNEENAIVIDFLNSKLKLQENIHNGLIHKIRNNDDSSESQSISDSSILRLEETIIHDVKKFVLEMIFEKTDIDQKDYVFICNSIANLIEKYSLKSTMAAEYIIQYVDWFIKYGNIEKKSELMEYVITIYQFINSVGVFCPDEEKAWDQYVNVLIVNEKKEICIKISKEHLNESRKAKDWYWAGCWCANLVKLYQDEEDTFQANKYELMIGFYSYRLMQERKTIECKYRNELIKDKMIDFDYYTNENNSILLVLRFADIQEKKSDLIPAFFDNSAVSMLHKAIDFRERYETEKSLKPTINSIKIRINRAKICIRRHNYEEANKILHQIIELYQGGNYNMTIGLLEAHELLGDIAILEEKYTIAEEEFDLCLEISKVLNIQDEYSFKIKLGSVYNKLGDLIRSEKLNLEILSDLISIDRDCKKHLLADAYFNIGDMYMLKGDYHLAMKHFRKADSIYEKATRLFKYNNIGSARCHVRFTEISMNKGLPEDATKYLKTALKLFVQMLGKDHPETLACKEKLDRYKSNFI